MYNREVFYDHVRRSPFGGSLTNAQVQGMDALLDFIDRFEWWPRDNETKFFDYWNAYVFATAKHETAHTMQPITEMGSQAYLQGKDYYPYIGRGFVQLTWQENYAKSDKAIAENGWVHDPSRFPDGEVHQEKYLDQALDLEVAGINIFKGMHEGWYTSKKLWDYLTNHKQDYFEARRIVNGTDMAGTIAAIADDFEIAFDAAWEDDPAVEPPPVETVTLTLLQEVGTDIARQLDEQL